MLAAATVIVASAGRAEPIVGLVTAASSFQLVSFDSASPGAVGAPTSITGLLDSSESIVGIDYRPLDGALVAVTRQGSGANVGRGRIYTINPITGVATLINGLNGLRNAGNNEVLLSDTNFFSYGIDFNPVVNALRIVSTSDQNLRITMGGAGVAVIDTPLNDSSGNPNINAIAYSNNVAGAIATTLYALNQSTPPTRLGTIGGVNGTPSPNTGTFSDIAPLNPTSVNSFTNTLGFDISGATGIAYASLRAAPPNETPTIYTLNLANGAATSLGGYGGSGLLYDITVVIAGPAPVPEPASLLLLGIGLTGLGWSRRRK